MICQSIGTLKKNGLPPCGGSGLKLLMPCINLYMQSLPPCGGSGLKSPEVAQSKVSEVSLHAEGVD